MAERIKKRTPPVTPATPATPVIPCKREFWMVHVLPGTTVYYARTRYKHVPGTPLKAIKTDNEAEFNALTAPGKGMRKATIREIKEVRDG